MSDDLPEEGLNHYYYMGRDRFPFADSVSSLPLEDDLDSYESQGEERMDALCSIFGSFLESETASARSSIAYSSTVNAFCRSMLQSIGERVSTGSGVITQQITPVSKQVALFPAGTRVKPETWQRLYEVASERLRRHGYLVTQHDKKYISAGAGVELTQYMWSTLMSRMDLRRVDNPFSSPALVIYVPRSQFR